jgi:hypothetical protein
MTKQQAQHIQALSDDVQRTAMEAYLAEQAAVKAKDTFTSNLAQLVAAAADAPQAEDPQQITSFARKTA